MTILFSNSLVLSSTNMLVVLLTLLGVLKSAHLGASTNPGVPKIDVYDPNFYSRGDDLGLFDPFYDNGNPNDPTCRSPNPPFVLPVYKVDTLQLQFAQNLEHLEADFFLWGALGYGLDKVAPELTLGGPPPIGGRKAALDNLTRSIITEFGYEEVGHLRILKSTVGGIPRPLLDLSPENFAKVVNVAFDYDLKPPFDPYRDSLSYVLGSYLLPYLGINAYVGANAYIKGYVSRRLIAGLLGVESGQDAVIRTYLYLRNNEIVHPYNFTVAEFTNQISTLRNKLGNCGIKDEGIVVPTKLGSEGKTTANVLASNHDSIAYARTAAEVLRVVYGTGNEHIPGGFYPKGGNGAIARSYLK